MVILLLSLFSGCSNAPASSSDFEQPRPVTVLRLEMHQPSRDYRIAASVVPWKEEQLAFELAGRLTYTVQTGVDIRGRTVDGDGNELASGEVLARLDPRRREINARVASARVDALKRQREAARIDLDRILPARVETAQARLETAHSSYERSKSLLKDKAISEEAYERHVSDKRIAEASLQQAIAAMESKRAEIGALEAHITESEELLAQAQLDVRDCALVAPFRGQVSAVHEIPGAFVDIGQPVIALQMMDPIKVEFPLSSARERPLNEGDTVQVLVPDFPKPITGWVDKKDAIADMETRTFTVNVLVRNQKMVSPPNVSHVDESTATVDSVWPLETETENLKGPYYAETRTIHRDETGPFLWKVTNLDVHNLPIGVSPMLDVQKVRVSLGEKQIFVLGIYQYREVRVLGDELLRPGRELVLGRMPEAWDGTQVILKRERWLLRPGDVVHVTIPSDQACRGWYVPTQSIQVTQNHASVFIVQTRDQEDFARKIAVRLLDEHGTLRRIEPVHEGDLKDGSQIITQGAPFLTDSERISVVGIEEVLP